MKLEIHEQSEEWYNVPITIWYNGVNAPPTYESWPVEAFSPYDAMEKAKRHFMGWFAEIGYALPAELSECKR